MSKLKFDASDFNDWPGMNYTREGAAIAAQRIFDKWLEAQPVVYGRKHSWHEGPQAALSADMSDTHQARLVCIEEIRPKECAHNSRKIHVGDSEFECVLCQKIIKPKGGWETV
jgi:hypothetical protein